MFESGAGCLTKGKKLRILHAQVFIAVVTEDMVQRINERIRDDRRQCSHSYGFVRTSTEF